MFLLSGKAFIRRKQNCARMSGVIAAMISTKLIDNIGKYVSYMQKEIGLG